MQTPLILVTKLDELTKLADTEDPIAQASIYSAVKTIQTEFKNSKIGNFKQIIEILDNYCFYVCASIGYEFIVKKTKQESLSFAKKKLEELRCQINQTFY